MAKPHLYQLIRSGDRWTVRMSLLRHAGWFNDLGSALRAARDLADRTRPSRVEVLDASGNAATVEDFAAAAEPALACEPR